MSDQHTPTESFSGQYDRGIKPQDQAFEGFPVEKTCTAVKMKIEKLEDEEKEKMSFYPKGQINLLHYLCKHDIAELAAGQGWKLVLENVDLKLVAKLQIDKETPIENCRDKVRDVIVKALPHIHQERLDLSSLSSRDTELDNQGTDLDKREQSSTALGDRDLVNRGLLQKAYACLIPLVKAIQSQAELFYDTEMNCLVITGDSKAVKNLYTKAKARLYSVTIETVLESAVQGHLLRRFGFIGHLKGQYPNVSVVIQNCNTKLTWQGTEEDVRLCRSEMEKFVNKIKTDTFQISSVMEKLLSTEEVENYIDSVLKKESISCVWKVTETRQVQIWSLKSLSSKHAGLKIRESLKEDSFLVKEFPFILEVSRSGFDLPATERKHFALEVTSDTVHVAAISDTMQKIIQHLQNLEDQKSAGRYPSGNQGEDNSNKRIDACTIEVRGMNTQTSDETVALYFESRRAIGQVADIEKFDASKREGEGVIFITYENEQVAQLVLERPHTLQGSPLSVKLFKEPDYYKDRVFFSNLNSTTTKKALEKFLRSKVKVSPIEILYGEEDSTVLVTFDGCLAFDELNHACQDSPLDKCVLEARRVPLSQSVLVCGVQKGTSIDTLYLYFENIRRSGGGDVNDVNEVSKGKFVIVFENNEVTERVCKRPHVIDGQTLSVQIYYEMLGYRVNHTGPVHKVPQPLVVTDPNKIQHIMACDTTELEKQLKDQHAKLHRPEDIHGPVKLECLLTEDVKDSDRLVLTWEDVIRATLTKFLSQARKAQVVVPKIHPQTGDETATPSVKNEGDSTHSENGSQSTWQSHSATGYSSVSSVDFRTAEGLLVRVYSGSILHLDVDCIVNAANGDLQHGGGVAQVISSAAGYEFDRESRDYIARHGPLGVGHVCTTTAGNLKYKGVVHAVGPRWYDYGHDQKRLCLEDLQSAVQNSLNEADIQGYKSIAIPAISAGLSGLPNELHAQQYRRAVAEYSKTRGHNSTLTEVHFVDKDTQMCELIQKTFTAYFGRGHSYRADNGDRIKFLSCQKSKREFSSSLTGDAQRRAEEVVEDCFICMDTITIPKELSCGHIFCTDCIDHQFKYKPTCPTCGAVHGKITGDQPPGTMTTQTMKLCGKQKSLPGYSGCGVINIIYSFPSGIQGSDHPSPGKHYQGITRGAYLPDNEKGRLVAKLLKIAFDRKLVFTIGRSRTTGFDGVIIWNDIHHKTRMDGGPQAYGYPDPSYLGRVLDDLKAKGITEESLHATTVGDKSFFTPCT